MIDKAYRGLKKDGDEYFTLIKKMLENLLWQDRRSLFFREGPGTDAGGL